MSSNQTSLRLDQGLLSKIDEMAALRGEPRTEVIETALQWWVTTNGGRGIASSITPPGLTPKFDEWLSNLKPDARVTLLLLDPAGQAPWAYSGELLACDLEQAREAGVFFLRIEWKEREVLPVPIPRGLILAYTSEGEKLTKPLFMALWGARDGNAHARALVRIPDKKQAR